MIRIEITLRKPKAKQPTIANDPKQPYKIDLVEYLKVISNDPKDA